MLASSNLEIFLNHKVLNMPRTVNFKLRNQSVFWTDDHKQLFTTRHESCSSEHILWNHDLTKSKKIIYLKSLHRKKTGRKYSKMLQLQVEGLQMIFLLFHFIFGSSLFSMSRKPNGCYFLLKTENNPRSPLNQFQNNCFNFLTNLDYEHPAITEEK